MVSGCFPVNGVSHVLCCTLSEADRLLYAHLYEFLGESLPKCSKHPPTENVLECHFQGWKMVLPEGVEFVILGWGDKVLPYQILVWGGSKCFFSSSGQKRAVGRNSGPEAPLGG